MEEQIKKTEQVRRDKKDKRTENSLMIPELLKKDAKVKLCPRQQEFVHAMQNDLR